MSALVPSIRGITWLLRVQRLTWSSWWLNITCAERDGIVNSSLETPTKGCYGITALPLLTGSEELIRDNTVKYVREGRSFDMHVPLISQVGRKIRILRGYKLKSIFAPSAGLRYDGLYVKPYKPISTFLGQSPY